ncbi:helix-turn-helix transcriptional regulator [Cytophagaceae bacterium YF14B1]|uniref:Helix-turn-helix transcriptional regulator n=1 Tax=Xanthocytophaga flava TaxID=3048013 RepID=A0AAE3R0N3_9BACT|nr:helix-turn-helix transcriptional regulator [Xanthocytophaga flavus]MDJ1485948.1 helix-turn-helix transcriptional regulator [Xanthocytophaga flavus]
MESASSHEINTDMLSAMIKEKRGERSLRQIATEIGDVSIATLSRVEQGKIPDLDTFVKLCRWLEVSGDVFINNSKNSKQENEEQSVAEKVAIQLRADRTLSKKTVDALIQMINLAYAANQNNELIHE